MAARSRLLKELRDAVKNREETGIELRPVNDNIFSWTATFEASTRSPPHHFITNRKR
jgi:ubiquitin-protein ligase